MVILGGSADPLNVNIMITYVSILENVEHCGGEPEQADMGRLCHWWVM